MDLSDGLTKASISEVEIVFNRVLPVHLGGFVHDLLQTRVDDVDFASTSQVLHVGRVLWQLVAHSLENLNVLLLGVFLGHTAWGDVVQILEPLEVGTGDTTTVGKHVGDGDNAFLE